MLILLCARPSILSRSADDVFLRQFRSVHIGVGGWSDRWCYWSQEICAAGEGKCGNEAFFWILPSYEFHCWIRYAAVTPTTFWNFRSTAVWWFDCTATALRPFDDKRLTCMNLSNGQLIVEHAVLSESVSLQCFDTVGWATGRAYGL